MCSEQKKTKQDVAPQSAQLRCNAKLPSVSVHVTRLSALVSVFLEMRGSVKLCTTQFSLLSLFSSSFAPLRESTLQATHKWYVSAIEAFGLFSPHQLQPPLGCFCPQNQLSCQHFLEAPWWLKTKH